MMRKELTMGLLVYLASLGTMSAAVILQDDFSGTELDGDLWTTSSTSSAGAGVTVNDGWLLMETSGTRRDRLRTKDSFTPKHTVDMLIARPGEHMRYYTAIMFGTAQADYSYSVASHTW